MRSTGYVGIGTWSPSELLEVEDTGANVKLLLDRTDGATAVFTAASTQTHIGSLTNHEFRLYVNNSWKLRLNTNSSLETSTGAECTTTGQWESASSREYKENINPLSLDEAMSALSELNPVTFNYKVDKSEKEAGFISEEVPELVATKSRKTLDPTDIVAVLTKVVQEQQKTISELKERITALEKK
jgi:hypothetical protein